MVGFIGRANPSPSPRWKWFLVLDQQRWSRRRTSQLLGGPKGVEGGLRSSPGPAERRVRELETNVLLFFPFESFAAYGVKVFMWK